MEVAAARGEQVELAAEPRVFDIVGRPVGAGHHLHALTTVGLEFGEERELFVGGEVVAAGVGDHGHASGTGDPTHSVAQGGPAVRHIAGFALGQVFPKHGVGVGAVARFHDVAREVRA
ncbi:hypothetical protein FQZ97_1096960 [compost metagenome]